MEWTKGECSKLISFVSACAEDRDTNHTRTKQPKGNLKGSEARNFYENLVSDEKITTSKDEPVKNSTKKTYPISTEENNDRVGNSVYQASCQSDISELDINRYLRYAQEGNIQQVKNMLKKGVSVDSQDRYGWTALMCAAHNGQFEVVKHLLSIGADVSVVDENNKNVSDIARTAGFKKISLFIQKLKKGILQKDFQDKKVDRKSEEFYCQVCKCNFTDVTVKYHELSMVHLFNSKKKAKDDPFLLPASNKGYKMMLRSGWDGRKGLGPGGQGQRYPVKTILKRDRKCLGSLKDEKPKITHFNANEKKAIQRNPERKLTKKILNKRDQRAKEKKQRQWERNLRSSMSSDF